MCLCVQHLFFFLLQTEQGDVFKVTLDTEDDIVSLSMCVGGGGGGVHVCESMCMGVYVQRYVWGGVLCMCVRGEWSDVPKLRSWTARLVPCDFNYSMRYQRN